MRKLILRCGLALGDTVMLTTAVRDLHYWYPGRFLTDVRTFYPELWENNPNITRLSEKDSGVEEMECTYPLINQANKAPYHCLQGFIEFLNERLRLSIKPTVFKGDIHFTEREKSWHSQVYELTKEDTPFWIIGAGGKYDVTIKWWDSRRYQEVVNYFRGRIQFVQVGHVGHHHPRLEGVIDLRGKTNLRELLRLVHHAQGVLCSITSLMHLAAAVETRPGRPRYRACVVVAGGREPAHWEAYPGHQFIHVNGALKCCAIGGCWRDRTFRLGDGDKRDKDDCLCVDTVGRLPRCMDMISAEEVIRRIELFYANGALRFLTARQQAAAQRGISSTANNPFDQEPLHIRNAGMSCDQYIETIAEYPNRFEGRGIVICGGGIRYFTNAWVCIHMLRRLGCRLPVQLWHLGSKELNEEMRSLIAPLGVECVDAHRLRRKFPARLVHGWVLKPYAIVHCPFREILLLDADNVPVVNPEFLFETAQFRETGAIFWPDYFYKPNKKATAIWRSCGLRRPSEPEFETGQIVVDKKRCWRVLQLSMWFNENSDFYYRHIHGDKETFHLAFRKLCQPYALVPTKIQALEGTMCQHDFEGRRILQHRNMDKWDIMMCNRRVKDFWLEAECVDYVRRLREVWSPLSNGATTRVRTRHRALRSLRIQAVMISCVERSELCKQTVENLRRTDWGDLPLHVQVDEARGKDYEKRQTRCAFLALSTALKRQTDYVLFLEDDLDFNRHLRHNICNWLPLREGSVDLGGLYNPRLREIGCDPRTHSRVIPKSCIYGSQAFLISRPALTHIVQNWGRVEGLQDIKISRLAARLGKPILYHAPSLVQHVGAQSVWGGKFHQAMDFDQNWRS